MKKIDAFLVDSISHTTIDLYIEEIHQMIRATSMQLYTKHMLKIPLKMLIPITRTL